MNTDKYLFLGILLALVVVAVVCIIKNHGKDDDLDEHVTHVQNDNTEQMQPHDEIEMITPPEDEIDSYEPVYEQPDSNDTFMTNRNGGRKYGSLNRPVGPQLGMGPGLYGSGRHTSEVPMPLA